jgi:antitoxin component YwqK of YwqJK toxin-antitoxin module
MKNLIFFLIPFFFFNSVYAQTYRDTIKIIKIEEPWTETVNGEIRSVMRTTYKKTFTKHDGYNEIYDENGHLSFTGTYIINNEKIVENDSFHYYYTNGNIENEGKFTNGEKTGIWNHYNKEGILESQTDYESLTLSYFYPNGKIRAAGPYAIFFSKNEPSGAWKFYYENGICECEGTYYDSLKYGKWKYYSADNTFLKKIRHQKYTANYNYNFLEACKW